MISAQPQGSVTNPIGSALINLTQIYIHEMTGTNLIRFMSDITKFFLSGNEAARLIQLYETPTDNFFNKQFTLYYSDQNNIIIGISPAPIHMLYIYPKNILYHDVSTDRYWIGNINDVQNISSQITFVQLERNDDKHSFGWNNKMEEPLYSKYGTNAFPMMAPLFTCYYTLRTTLLHNVLSTVTEIYRSIYRNAELRKYFSKVDNFSDKYKLLSFNSDFPAGNLICPPHIKLIVKCITDICDDIYIVGFYNLFTKQGAILTYTNDDEEDSTNTVYTFYVDGDVMKSYITDYIVVHMSYVTLLFGGFDLHVDWKEQSLDIQNKKRKVDKNNETITGFINDCKITMKKSSTLSQAHAQKVQDLKNQIQTLQSTNSQLNNDYQTLLAQNAILNEQILHQETLQSKLSKYEEMLTNLNHECNYYLQIFDEIIKLIST